MDFLKNTNKFNFNELHIEDPLLMNSLMYTRNEDKPRIIQQSVCEKIDKINSSVYSFAMYDSIENIELYSHEKGMNQGKGFYNYIKKLCFPNVDINKKRYSVMPGLLYHNEKYMEEELKNVWCYDLNSAYLSILAKGYYPNMDKPLGPGIVKQGQLGFSEWAGIIDYVEIGEYAEHRFEKVYSDKLSKWAKEKYSHLNSLKMHKEDTKRVEFKLAIVAAIGIIRNHNIFLYSYIVGSCRKFMESLIDENTLICNTDSIMSIGERKDLKISNKLGEFKLEHKEVDFIYYKSNYQISKGGEVIHTKYRGVPKAAQRDMDFKERVISTPSYYLQGEQLYGEKIREKTKK